jgi:phosphoglycerate dehydrogenase-like enzyme
MSAPKIRLHIHDPKDVGAFACTPEVWAAAAARNPTVAAQVEVSFGNEDELFHATLPQCDAVMTSTGEGKRLLADAKSLPPKLKIIQMTSAGLNRLAPFGWVPQGTFLCNNSGTHGAKAGQWGIMAVLMLANAMPYFATEARGEIWGKRFTHVVGGRTLVSVGVGDMATDTLKHAKYFGMKVIGVRARNMPHEHCDQVVTVEQLDAVLPQADCVLLAMPLTPESTGMISRARLALMKKGAGLVNIARGEVIDQEALADALESGHLGGAVIDVTVPEPLPKGHRLWRAPNLTITPHVSSDDPETYTPKTLDILLRNLDAWQKGDRPPTAIDPVRWY